jgi:hypothetical protein
MHGLFHPARSGDSVNDTTVGEDDAVEGEAGESYQIFPSHYAVLVDYYHTYSIHDWTHIPRNQKSTSVRHIIPSLSPTRSRWRVVLEAEKDDGSARPPIH